MDQGDDLMASKKDSKDKSAKATTNKAKKARNPLQLALGAVSKVIKREDVVVAVDEKRLRESIPHIPTGSIIIDYLIGGRPTASGVIPCPGFPRKRLVNLYGHESCGKTTLALKVAASVIAAGGTVCYIDWEHSIDLIYAAGLGIPVKDDDKFILSQPNTLEDGLKVMWAMLLAGVDLIVVDSVGAAVPEAIMKQKLKDKGATTVGLRARQWSEFLPQIRSVASRTGSCVVGISQTRTSISTGPRGGSGQTVQGGNAWKFYSDVRITLRRKSYVKGKVYNPITNQVEEKVVASVVIAKLDKNRLCGSQGHEAEFHLKWGTGIDDFQSVIDIVAAHGIVKKTGAWYAMDTGGAEPIRVQGKDPFIKVVNEDPKLVKQLREAAIRAIAEAKVDITLLDETPEEDLGELEFLTE